MKRSVWLGVEMTRAGGYFPDPIETRLVQKLRASQDFPTLEAALFEERGWQIEDAFHSPAGLRYLRTRFQDPLLAASQREKLVALEKRFTGATP